MLGLIIVQLLAVPASCQARCSTDNQRCFSRCSPSQPNCNRHCDDLNNSCNAQCANQQSKAEIARQPKGMPCPTGGKVDRNTTATPIRPCTEAEEKANRAIMNSAEAQKAFKCRDPDGNPTPCPEDLKKAEQVIEDVGGEKAMCTDKNGRPTVCADTAKKAEESATSGVKKHP